MGEDAQSDWRTKTSLISARVERCALAQGLTQQEAFDSGFHMTDWVNDLEAFYSFCQNPDSYSDEELDDMLTQFLIHVPNHLAAAAKIYADCPVRDVFGVGAVELSDE